MHYQRLTVFYASPINIMHPAAVHTEALYVRVQFDADEAHTESLFQYGNRILLARENGRGPGNLRVNAAKLSHVRVQSARDSRSVDIMKAHDARYTAG